MLSTNSMAALFGKSPFKPLQQHMRVVIECVGEVPALFAALIEGNEAQLEVQKEKIFAKEGEADTIKNELRSHLPRSLLLAVDRRDLLELLAMQDTIAGIAQDIAGLLVQRHADDGGGEHGDGRPHQGGGDHPSARRRIQGDLTRRAIGSRSPAWFVPARFVGAGRPHLHLVKLLRA